MAALVVTNTFVTSTLIESAKMNTNFDDIETYINNRNSGAASWDVANATAATITTLTVTTLTVTSLNFLPSGTKMPFYQASPPTGWTAVAVNDKFMRVVTSAGTGGTNGGSVAASTSLAHTHTVSSHTHDLGNHTHSTPTHQHTIATTATNDLAETPSASLINGKSYAVRNNSSSSNPIQIVNLDGTTGIGEILTGVTATDGSGTSGAPSSNTSGATAPGTDSQLGVFAYADFCVGTKN